MISFTLFLLVFHNHLSKIFFVFLKGNYIFLCKFSYLGLFKNRVSFSALESLSWWEIFLSEVIFLEFHKIYNFEKDGPHNFIYYTLWFIYSWIKIYPLGWATDPLFSKRILLIVFTGKIKWSKLLWTGSIVLVLLFFMNPLEYNGIKRL